MGLRFRKSINVGDARVNISKSGVGYSYGKAGIRRTHKAGGGTRTTASIPRTGVSYVTESGKSKKNRGCLLLGIIILFFPISLSVWFFRTDKLRLSKGARAGILAAVWILIAVFAGTSAAKPEPVPALPSGVETVTEAPKAEPEAEKPAPAPSSVPSEFAVSEEPAEEKTVYVYVAAGGDKFHDSGCRTIKDSAVEQLTPDEAIARGYQACGICHPVTK